MHGNANERRSLKATIDVPMLGTIIEQNGDGLLEDSHMPVGWPLHIDGAVRQCCIHRSATPQELDDMLREYDMKRDSVEINHNAPQWSHNGVWNRKYMEPKTGYTLRQLWARRPDGSVGMALVLPALTDCRWWFESLLVHSGVSSATRRKAPGPQKNCGNSGLTPSRPLGRNLPLLMKTKMVTFAVQWSHKTEGIWNQRQDTRCGNYGLIPSQPLGRNLPLRMISKKVIFYVQ